MYIKSTALFIGLIGVIIYGYKQLVKVPPLPKLKDTWWGPGAPSEEHSGVERFKINVPNEIIDDLRYRLDHALPFQPPLEGAGQDYGMNTKLLEKIARHWRTRYNWTERQQFLNQYEQFQTNIQGLKIHFLHVKPKNPGGLEVRPLLILHGWPGSVREFYEIMPFLTTPQKGRGYVFEVIAPSLPGYGFSDGAARPGLGPSHMAHILKNLMKRLGFDRYYLQGGDWGSIISQAVAEFYPEHVIGVHLNLYYSESPTYILKLLIGSYFPSLVVDELERERNYPLSNLFWLLVRELGFFSMQATKPDTVGVALRDSPLGLAAYILEKFYVKEFMGGREIEEFNLDNMYSMEQLLDNLMIYWVSRCTTTSARLYAESMRFEEKNLKLLSLPITVPSGVSRFPFEITYPPKKLLKDRLLQLVYVKDHKEGGHFAALEKPEELAEDIYEFVEIVENISKNKQD